jgi:hypothetical protein
VEGRVRKQGPEQAEVKLDADPRITSADPTESSETTMAVFMVLGKCRKEALVKVILGS